MSIKAMNWVWQNVRIQGDMKIVLLALADNADDNGVSWPSLQTIADKAEISHSTAKRKVRQLIKLGIVSVARRIGGYNNTTNKYRLNLHLSFDLRSEAIPTDEPEDDSRVNLTPLEENSGVSHVNPLPENSRVNLTPLKEGSRVTAAPPQWGHSSDPRTVMNRQISNHHDTYTSQSSAGRREFGVITAEWQPSETCRAMLAMRCAGISPEFIDNVVSEFILYWRERNRAFHAGAWDQKFLKHTVGQWERHRALINNPDRLAKPIPRDFWPSEETATTLMGLGMSQEVLIGLVSSYRRYWIERDEARHAWNSRFHEWAIRKYGELVSQPGGSIEDRIRDRSWADTDFEVTT
jgi:hypothetical protein